MAFSFTPFSSRYRILSPIGPVASKRTVKSLLLLPSPRPFQVIDEENEGEEEEGPARSSQREPPARQGQQLLPGGVSQKGAQQLLYSLESTVAVIVQFMVGT